MTMRKSPRSTLAVLRDMRRDWRGWSRAERLTLKLAGMASLAIAAILIAPHIA